MAGDSNEIDLFVSSHEFVAAREMVTYGQRPRNELTVHDAEELADTFFLTHDDVASIAFSPDIREITSYSTVHLAAGTEMWRVLIMVCLCVARGLGKAEMPPCESSFLDAKIRPSRQLDFGDKGECCPCTATASGPPTGPADRRRAGSAELVGPDSTETSPERKASDPCSCTWKGEDLVPEPSTAVRAVSRGAKDYARFADPADPKTLFGPEIRLISSVLETLKAANEEELTEVRSRAASGAAAAAVPSDVLGSPLLSSRKLTSPIKTSGRSATVTVKSAPTTFVKPNLISSSIIPRGKGSTNLQDNIGSPSWVSTQNISPKALGGPMLPLRQHLSLFPRLGSPLIGRSKIESKPFTPLSFSNSQPGKIKATNSVVDIDEKDKINSKINSKLGQLAASKPNLKELLSKTKANFSTKKGLTALKTSPKLVSNGAHSKMSSDMVNAASSRTSAIKQALNSPSKFKLGTVASNLKVTPKINPKLIEPKRKIRVKPVSLLGNSPLLPLKPVGSQKGDNILLKDIGYLPQNNNPLEHIREFDALKLGSRLLDGLNKVRNTVVNSLLGKSLLNDNNSNGLPKSSDRDLVSKSTNDMESASSNDDGVVQLPKVCSESSPSNDEAIVEPEILTEATLSKVQLKSSKAAAQAKKPLGSTNFRTLDRKSSFKSAKPMNAEKSQTKKQPLENGGLDDIEGKEDLSSTKTLVPSEANECSKCTGQPPTEPFIVKGEKVFNCKLVCDS